MKTSPTQRSLKLLKSLGYDAQVVEKWNPFAKIRQDLFGWIDIVAVHAEKFGILGVQTTTGDHLAARIGKAKGNGKLAKWLLAGGHLQAHGWRKLKGKWEVREVEVTLSDIVGGGQSGVD